MTPFKGTNRVTSPYGWRVINGIKEFHNGMDIVGDQNTMTRAIWDCSKVEYVQGYNGGRGNTAYLYYNDKMRVLYQHLANIHQNVLNKTVKQGHHVGVMGNTGYSFGAHLHIEVQVYQNGRWTPVNPAAYVEVANVIGRHAGNDKYDNAGPAPVNPEPAPAGPLYTLAIGPASMGDKNTLEAMANQLGLPVAVTQK